MTTALMEKPASTCTVISGYVDTAYLEKMFRRSSLTIGLWRKNRGLPWCRFPGDARDAVRFIKADVVAWAKRNGIEVFIVPRLERRV